MFPSLNEHANSKPIETYTRKCSSAAYLLTFVGIWMQPLFSYLTPTSFVAASYLNIVYSVFSIANVDRSVVFLMLVLKGLILPLCDGYMYKKRLIRLL